jgi:hypothetical protein
MAYAIIAKSDLTIRIEDVIESGAKTVITPTYMQNIRPIKIADTYLNFGRLQKSCDIILSSEVLICIPILSTQV